MFSYGPSGLFYLVYYYLSNTISMNALMQYLKDTRHELTLVRWPSRTLTITYTILVIGLSVVVALYLTALDTGFLYGFNYLLERFNQ